MWAQLAAFGLPKVYDWISGGEDGSKWRKGLGLAATGLGGWGLNKAAGGGGSGYREPWSGFMQDRKNMYEDFLAKSKEDLPYVPGYAPTDPRLTAAWDINSARAMANLNQGYGGHGMQNYTPLDLSGFGVAQNTVPTFEKPDFQSIWDNAQEKAASAVNAAQTPGQPPPPPPPAGSTGNVPTMGPQASTQAPGPMHDGGFRPRGGDIASDAASGMPLEKLQAMHGADAVNNYFRDRRLPLP